jgi:hypothetical protein
MSYPDYDTPRLTGVYAEVAAERAAQDATWGEQNHPDGTGEPGSDSVAAAARTLCQGAAASGHLDWLHILREEVAEAFAESDPAKLRAELVQVAAVATAWIEAIDRRTTTGDEDACRVVEVDGEPIRVHGSGEMSDESRAALAEVIGAARAKYVAEHPDGVPVISPRVAAHVLWQEGLGGYAAGSFTTALLKAWWQADPANGARLARTWPEYGAAIALLTQPGGSNRLRAIAGEQPAPDRP